MSLAAAFTGLQVDYVDGVTNVELKALPPGGNIANLNHGSLGSWRAHVNVIRMIVEQNVTSALVLEDDADWDVRIKSQMRDFARAAQLLIQPLPGTTSRFLDPTYHRTGSKQVSQHFVVGKYLTAKPKTSPYGDIDRWDLLWIGHCGSRFPRAANTSIPLGRAVLLNDDSVPEGQHINIQYGNDDLVKEYPTHTRVVSRAYKNGCTLGYGISQRGAQRLLYELGIHKMTSPADDMFSAMCDGREDRQMATCLSVQPELFQHHRPVGYKASYSDITDHGRHYNEQAFTRNIRWSTRVNIPRFIEGRTDYIDQYKDGEAADEDLEFK